MFLYLLYNSNLILDTENKLIKLIIYGIILYIILHIIINNIVSTNNYLGYYFWIIFILDCLIISSLIITESNGDLLINKIIDINKKNIKRDKSNESKKAETINQNLNNTNTKTKINLENEEEFNKFINELTTDSNHKNKQNENEDNEILRKLTNLSISEEQDIFKPINTKKDNLETKDERESMLENFRRMNNNLQKTDNKNIIESLKQVSNNNIDSDIDIDSDINDFDNFIQ